MVDRGAVENVARRAAGRDVLAIDGGDPVRQSWLPYGRQSVCEADIAAVVGALKSDWLTQGPAIELFEKKLAEATGAQYAVALNSGTAALHAAYFASGIGGGDEIVTAGITFAATANAALYLGATVRFADVLPGSGNIDPELVEAQITPRTKAIVGIDFAGHPCDIDGLASIARRRGVKFIQDSAHALGAMYKGSPVGALSDMTCFSFHPVKAITTGEGGAVTTNDAALAHKLRLFRTHGIEKTADNFLCQSEGPWYHEMQFLGFNYRLTDFQAALGASQLDRLGDFVARRQQIAVLYRQGLAGNALFSCLEESPQVQSAYHLFPVLVESQPYASARKFVFEALHAENIGVQVHYIPVYHHPYYKRGGVGGSRLSQGFAEICPETERFYERVLSLPIFPAMDDGDVLDVLAACDKITNAVRRGRKF